jgi:hypothetical protein
MGRERARRERRKTPLYKFNQNFTSQFECKILLLMAIDFHFLPFPFPPPFWSIVLKILA